MNLKKYLPYESYTLVNSLSLQEIQQRLFEVTEINRSLKDRIYNRAQKEYEGTIYSNEFKISRIIKYRNSFLPVIKGRIEAGIYETKVHITMQPQIVVLIFMAVWMSGVGSACLFITGAFLTGSQSLNHDAGLFLPIPFAMFIFGWCLCYFGFKAESKKSKQFLEILLKNRPYSGRN